MSHDRIMSYVRGFTATNENQLRTCCGDTPFEGAAAREGNARCKAWTYVNPGVQGPGAKCWLEHTAGTTSSNACCATGTP